MAPLQFFVRINAEVATLNFENLHLSLNEKRLYAFFERSENAHFFPSSVTMKLLIHVSCHTDKKFDL